MRQQNPVSCRALSSRGEKTYIFPQCSDILRRGDVSVKNVSTVTCSRKRHKSNGYASFQLHAPPASHTPGEHHITQGKHQLAVEWAAAASRKNSATGVSSPESFSAQIRGSVRNRSSEASWVPRRLIRNRSSVKCALPRLTVRYRLESSSIFLLASARHHRQEAFPPASATSQRSFLRSL